MTGSGEEIARVQSLTTSNTTHTQVHAQTHTYTHEHTRHEHTRSRALCPAPKDLPSLCDGTCGLLIFVILLLGGLLVVGIVIFIRVHKLSLLNVQFGVSYTRHARDHDADTAHARHTHMPQEMSEQLNHPSESMSLNSGNMPSDRM